MADFLHDTTILEASTSVKPQSEPGFVNSEEFLNKSSELATRKFRLANLSML